MNLGMPICEGKAASTIMKAGRHVHITRGTRGISGLVAIAGGREGAIINAVGVFVYENKRLGRQNNIRQLTVKSPLGAQPSTDAEDLAHGIATDARGLYPVSENHCMVRRAFVYALALTGVSPDGAFGHV